MPKREMRSLKRFCVASIYALILIVVVGVNRLDAQVRTATISGTATDSSGAVLVGAKIEVKNLGTGITQSAITDSQGRDGCPHGDHADGRQPACCGLHPAHRRAD